jgi:adenylate cyclase
MTIARKLAAILAADVVGYSRMMGEDEAGTARAVRERREAAETIAAASRRSSLISARRR